MARHRARPARKWFGKSAPVAAAPAPEPATPDHYDCDSGECEACALQEELDDFFEGQEQAAAAADLKVVHEPPVTAPVARVVDLAERRTPPTVGGADIVMMTRTSRTTTMKAVYPDGSMKDIRCELRVVASLDRVEDGMVLNLSGGGGSASIAVTTSP